MPVPRRARRTSRRLLALALGASEVRLSELTKTRVSRTADDQPNHLVVRLTDDLLFKCPMIEMEDVGTMRLSETEVVRLITNANARQRAIDFNQAITVQSEWERAGKRPLAVVQPLRFRMIAAQFRDPRPREGVPWSDESELSATKAALVERRCEAPSSARTVRTSPTDTAWTQIDSSPSKLNETGR